MKNLAHDWLKIKESEVLLMSLEEVLVECRMMKDHNKALKSFHEKQEKEIAQKNKKLSL